MRRFTQSKLVVAAIGVAILSAVGATSVQAGINEPGSARTIANLVAASTHVTTLPNVIATELATSNADSPQRVYPSLSFAGCAGGATCTFAVKHARKVVVLFGDSHAMMWLPAVATAVKHADERLVLIWAPGRCAVAQLPTAYSYSGATEAGCSAWHANAIHLIKSLHPRLILLGERTSEVYSEPKNVPFTKTQWQIGLEKAIKQLRQFTNHVAVIEDVIDFDTLPQTCLAAYPTDIQAQCSVKTSNPTHPGQQVAERAAAIATGAGFIKTLPWFCAATCSPVIGDFLPYYDQSHVSATYAQYLSGVMATALKPYL